MSRSSQNWGSHAMPRQLCSRWRTDSTSPRPRLEPSRRYKYHSRSPVRSPGYGASTSAAEHAARGRLVDSKYRASCCALPPVERALHCTTGTVHGHTVRIVTPNPCSLPHLTTGRALEHLQRRSTPDPTCAEPCLDWRWQAGQCPLSVSACTPPLSPGPAISRSARPRLPIAVRLLVPSSRPRPEPLLARWCRMDSTTQMPSQHGTVGQPSQGSSWQLRAAQGKTDRDGTGEACGASCHAAGPARTCCTCEARLTGACCT